MADKPEKGKTKVIYNRGIRSIKYFHDRTGKAHKFLAPGGQIELPEDQAKKLLNYEGIVDIKDVPKAQDLAALKAALDKKAEVDGLDQKQRAIVSALVREFVASNIERGKIPNTKLLDEQEVVRARSDEQDYSR